MKIIITHNNERTIKECHRLASLQATTRLLTGHPFRKSLKIAFREAIEEKLDWLVILAGDQYMNPGAIETLKIAIENTDSNVFRVSGYGYDHLMMRKRLMAPSMYRVSLLNKALKIETAGQVRPEAHILHTMERRGYPFIIIKDELAVHDIDQYYGDIYNKGHTAACKKIIVNGCLMYYLKKEHIIKDLRRMKDMDHRVFLLGIRDYQKQIRRTKQDVLELLNLTEKDPL